MPRLQPIVYSPDDYVKGANRIAGYINIGTVESKEELMQRLITLFKGEHNINATIRSGHGTVYKMITDLWTQQVEPRVKKDLPLKKIKFNERTRQLVEIRKRRKIGRQQAIVWFTAIGRIRDRVNRRGVVKQVIKHKKRTYNLENIIVYYNSKHDKYITRRKPKKRSRRNALKDTGVKK